MISGLSKLDIPTVAGKFAGRLMRLAMSAKNGPGLAIQRVSERLAKQKLPSSAVMIVEKSLPVMDRKIADMASKSPENSSERKLASIWQAVRSENPGAAAQLIAKEVLRQGQEQGLEGGAKFKEMFNKISRLLQLSSMAPGFDNGSKSAQPLSIADSVNLTAGDYEKFLDRWNEEHAKADEKVSFTIDAERQQVVLHNLPEDMETFEAELGAYNNQLNNLRSKQGGEMPYYPEPEVKETIQLD